jgi:hypothetical protein
MRKMQPIRLTMPLMQRTTQLTTDSSLRGFELIANLLKRRNPSALGLRPAFQTRKRYRCRPARRDSPRAKVAD